MSVNESFTEFFEQQWEDPTFHFLGACLEIYKDYKLLEPKIYEILPEVYVFKNLLPRIKEQVELLKNSVTINSQSFFFNDWQQWGGYDTPVIFGQYLVQLGNDIEAYKQDSKRDVALMHAEKEFVADVIKAFYGATNYFIDKFKLSKEDWKPTSPSFCRYIPTSSTAADGKFMSFHTDYQLDKAHEPGNKFVLTSTFYLNDDYEGGSIIFKVRGQEVMYKPEIGDIIVFPSGHPSIMTKDLAPLLHAVEPISVDGPDRWIVRMFYMMYSEGDVIPEKIKIK
jgi:hypothetical protein